MQGLASGLVGVQVPPLLVVSQKSPVVHWVSCVHAAHCVPLQYPLRQSPTTLQPSPSPHGVHEPPQSLPVSLPSWTPSPQLAETHFPLPSQTVPLLSVQVVPCVAFAVVHTLPAQETTAHRVGLSVQSAVATHSTHLPLPSHTAPPPLVHKVSGLAFVGAQTPPTQARTAQVVPVTGQSVAWSQATHLPLLSQTVPLLSLQVVPLPTFDVPHTPAVQVACSHSVVGVGQSSATTQPTQAPWPSQRWPPLVLQGVSEGRSV